MQTLEELRNAQQHVAEIEKQVLDDIRAKAELLGYSLVRQGTNSISQTLDPAPKRKRRTKAEIEAARSQEAQTVRCRDGMVCRDEKNQRPPVAEGHDVRMDLRWGGGDSNRMRALAEELTGLQPDIILTGGKPATAAVQRETRTTPIVFVNVSDPVAAGLVSRLDRPSGNITGFAILEVSMGGKWLELLSEIAPGFKRVALMFNPNTENSASLFYVPSLETAARSLKVEAVTAPVHSDVEIEAKFEMVLNLKAAKALGLTVPQSILLRADEVIE
jgi:ABC-type uncharacterized transport system substrate-binding protein